MKKWKAGLIVLSAMISLTALTAHAVPTLVPPPTVNGQSKNGLEPLTSAWQKKTLAQSPGAFAAEIRPVLLVASNVTSKLMLVNDAIAGKVLASHFDAQGNGYVLADGKITCQQLIESSDLPTNMSVVELVILHSVSETDDISPSAATVTSASADQLLNDQINLVGMLNPLAVVVKHDGTVIQSGTSDQLGQTVILIADMKTYNDTIPHVCNWTAAWGGSFWVKWQVLDSSGNVVATATVSFAGIVMKRPMLSIALPGDGNVNVWTDNGTTNSYYRLYARAGLGVTEPWLYYGFVQYTNRAVIPLDQSALFFEGAADATPSQ